ncbi:phosphotransferase [Roseomonas sp. PWR1]|uniref:Phosphotransferase n=1 Tax=Roseomonas nitratireducens TaxID=2820810 RepID=A0ABS4AZX6_9PROT|nr:phosphotransferase [Neoroseomonas nitratireducens]MBP0466928.1 phosphotransferase [Neoroseomonas nitratireducens]
MTALPATRAAIARLVPHQGAMCLLEQVESCDAVTIACTSGTHRDPANPLRRDGMLPAACGLEYALQAMALHGALTSGGAQGPGFLAALAGVEMAAERLDDVAGPLAVRAEALAQESRGFIYRFEVTGGGRALLSGRATILLA